MVIHKTFKILIREASKPNITAATCIASQLTCNKIIKLDTLYSSTVQSF